MLKYFSPLLLSTLLYSNTVGGIAVLVQDEPITLFEIKEFMSSQNMAQEAAIKTLIRQKLEKIEIKDRKINVSSQEIDAEVEVMAKQNNMDKNQFYMAMSQSRGISESELKAKVKETLLKKKLYNAIAFSKLSQPTDEEIVEYYNLHEEKFARPESFDVIIYQAATPQQLQQKIANPMFYSPDIQSEEATVEYSAVDPNLANMLHQSKNNAFTQIIKNPQGGYMSFFIKDKSATSTSNFDAYASEVTAAIMQDKRNQILNDYISRLKVNVDIQRLRLLE
ncbi:MAG: SurA N-terminal domain-containing protein [Campylobacterota bacterium]|nr:SurA N-terminal domain-containing protein [Campylobacterota bacterium]